MLVARITCRGLALGIEHTRVHIHVHVGLRDNRLTVTTCTLYPAPSLSPLPPSFLSPTFLLPSSGFRKTRYCSSMEMEEWRGLILGGESGRSRSAWITTDHTPLTQRTTKPPTIMRRDASLTNCTSVDKIRCNCTSPQVTDPLQLPCQQPQPHAGCHGNTHSRLSSMQFVCSLSFISLISGMPGRNTSTVPRSASRPSGLLWGRGEWRRREGDSRKRQRAGV